MLPVLIEISRVLDRQVLPETVDKRCPLSPTKPPGRPESPVAPVVRQLDRTIDFLDLIGACHKFVAATGRLVPQMRGRRLSEDEREVNHKNVDRVRATFSELRTAA